MSPIILYFASGDSLYPGAALLAVSVATSTRSLSPNALWTMRTATWVGLALIVMACPPFAWSIDALLGLAFVVWLVSGRRPEPAHGWSMLRIATTIAMVVLLLALSITEFLHRRLPRIRGEKRDHLVVIGDSISAGLGARVRPWPEVMKEINGADVTNLSKPGATMRDGFAMADRVMEQDRLVLIELGGNDLIAGEPAEDFARALDSVLARLQSPGRSLVMFELPLLPQSIAYGQVQRRLAKKYGVWLIPKRCLIAVISGGDATLDGIHLTDVGTHRMAALVANTLSPVLRMSITPTVPARHP